MRSTLTEPRQAAIAIRYGQETIAALCCRWTTGVVIDGQRVEAVVSAGALAAAGPVRNMLDRADPIAAETFCGELIGSCAVTMGLRDAIARAARAPFPVLVEGESGSGKELVARAMHRLSARRDRRLCTVNCAALSDDLLEAELFGHSRGAFTGAVGERHGLFEEADGGTLFLDEVGELSARAQAKLLRVASTSESSRPPIAGSATRSTPVASARTCGSGSTLYGLSCRRCASAPPISRLLPSTSGPTRRVVWDRPPR
jgi:transcriptional regulator with AAA-type ATPase domain